MRQIQAFLLQREVLIRGLLTLGFVVAFGGGCVHNQAQGRPWVHKVFIHGTKQVSEKDVKKKISIEGRSWFSPLTKHYLEAPFQVEVDKKRIETYYQVRGFHRAQVTSTKIVPYKGSDKEPEAVDVHFTVNEGPPTIIQHVVFQGIERLSAQEQTEVKNSFPVEEGQQLNREDYLKEKEQLLTQLQKKGYAFAKVDLAVDINRDTSSANIVLTLEPGKKVVFGETRVKGTEKTNPQAVKKHASIPKGHPFRPEDIEAAQGKLYQLGIYSSVRIEPIPKEGDPHVADILITVTEGTFNSARVGVSFEFEGGRIALPVKGEYSRYNFLGGLRTLTLGGRVGYAWLWSTEDSRSGPDVNLYAELTQPGVLGRNSDLKARIGFDLGIDYAYQYYGPSFSLGLRRSFFRERLQLGASYQFRYLAFFNTRTEILQKDPKEAGVLFGYHSPYHLGYFQESIALDFRNRSFDATKGIYLLLTAEQGGIYAGGAFTYEKLVPEVRGYVPLGPRVTLAGRVMFGQIFSHGDLGSPITQRFYLGGPNSHRGFNYNRLSPMYISEPKPYLDALAQGADKNPISPFPVGGDQMFLVQAEVRVNVAKLFGQWFSVVGFMDGGDVGAPSCHEASCQVGYEPSVFFSNLHWAAGFGLRYQTIIGTIRFDLGFRLNRMDPYEPGCSAGNPSPQTCIFNPDAASKFLDRMAFHLSIGEAF